ncbi:MAG: hypothetical protein ACJ8AS_07095 [Hyphomicrobiales bacterium]
MITLPIIVAPMSASGLRLAAAGIETPMETLESLSQAEKLDAKCRILSSGASYREAPRD